MGFLGISTKNLTNPSKWSTRGTVADFESGPLSGPIDKISGAEGAREQSEAAKYAVDQQLAEAERARQFLLQQAAEGYGFVDAGTTSAGLELSDARAKAEAAMGAAPNRLAELYAGGLGAGFQADPGYQFRLKQGQDAIDHRFAAQGGRNGGDAMKALAEYNQNFASNEFNNYAQRQMGMAGAADAGDWQRQAALAGLYTGTGSSLADLYYGSGTNKANLAQGLAAGNTGLSQSSMSAYGGAVPYAGGASTAQGNFYGGLAATAAGKLWDWATK